MEVTMPNWVHNIVKVRGDSAAIVKFLDRHVNCDGYFDFNTIVPEPKYKVETSSKYIQDTPKKLKGSIFEDDWFDWYNWRYKYWGTKWNAQFLDKLCFDREAIIAEDIRSIDIVFDTAWYAPVPVAKRLCNMYKSKLKIKWLWVSFESDIAGYIKRDDYGDGDIPGFYYKEFEF